MIDDNVYPLFQSARYDSGGVVDEDQDDDDFEWVTSCLDRIDAILSSKNTPYAKMLAEICSVIDEWRKNA
jgi:hypothetical protein